MSVSKREKHLECITSVCIHIKSICCFLNLSPKYRELEEGEMKEDAQRLKY